MALENKLMRRVSGWHDVRIDGISDLVLRARGATVLDVGCNRGLVGFEFANNGARLVHGCDHYADGIRTAREIFVDLRNVESQFEVVDLAQGPACMKPFGNGLYDIVLLLGTYHKLARVMSADLLSELMQHLGRRAHKYFGWRGYPEELVKLDQDFAGVGLKRIHTSDISDLGPAAIWSRSN